MLSTFIKLPFVFENFVLSIFEWLLKTGYTIFLLLRLEIWVVNFTTKMVVFFLQVIDWLDNHGDIFLKKNTSIGRSLQRSRALQKSHEHFESVAKVSTCAVS